MSHPRGGRLKLHVLSFWVPLTGEQVVVFLKHLLRQVRGPIVLVWDQHPIHGRKKVQAFLAKHPRLQVYPFPTAAPELNPMELVWTQMTEYTASTAPHNAAELQAIVMAGLARTRGSQRRLWACLYASDRRWWIKDGISV